MNVVGLDLLFDIVENRVCAMGVLEARNFGQLLIVNLVSWQSILAPGLYLIVREKITRERW